MVSSNLRSIADEFDDMVEERDFGGFVALAGLGAVGGVLAEMAQDRIAPRLNQPTDPSNTRGLGVSFGMKAVVGFILGMGALRMSGDVAVLLAVLGLGALVDAGVDLIEAGDTLRGSAVRRSTTSRSTRTRTRSTPTRTVSSRQGSGTGSPSRTRSHQKSDRNRDSSSVPSGQSDVPAAI